MVETWHFLTEMNALAYSQPKTFDEFLVIWNGVENKLNKF